MAHAVGDEGAERAAECVPWRARLHADRCTLIGKVRQGRGGRGSGRKDRRSGSRRSGSCRSGSRRSGSRRSGSRRSGDRGGTKPKGVRAGPAQQPVLCVPACGDVLGTKGGGLVPPLCPRVKGAAQLHSLQPPGGLHGARAYALLTLVLAPLCDRAAARRAS